MLPPSTYNGEIVIRMLANKNVSNLRYYRIILICIIHKNIKVIIIKSLDPLRAKKTFIRKKLDHTVVSAIKASSLTL